MNHLLRGLKNVAERARVAHATLHKFRLTYATRLLEKGCDIVTVQHLMGHCDLDTTRQYLSPDDTLKRKAVGRLSLTGSAPGVMHDSPSRPPRPNPPRKPNADSSASAFRSR